MMRGFRTCVAVALLFCSSEIVLAQPAAAPAQTCTTAGQPLMRTTLYFGLTQLSGRISERQWRHFLRDEVTPRFPSGFTVWDAQGQWRLSSGRIVREPSKVLLVVHSNSATERAALSDLVGVYRERYDQESVLWEDAAVCAAF